MTVNVTDTMRRRLGWLTFWLAVISLALGIIGYARTGAPDGPDSATSYADLVYQSIRILRLGVADTRGDLFLEAGRWLGVLFLFSVIVTFLIPRLEYLWRRMRIRLCRQHLVVIGSGQRAMAHLADLGKRERIVWSDKQELDPVGIVQDQALRCQPPRYIAGDIESRRHLRSLAVHRARRMIIAAGDDTLNLNIAWQALELLNGQARQEPLIILAHIENFRLTDQLIEALPNSQSAIIRPFSLPVISSRSLAARHPFILAGWYGRVVRPHWLFIGFDRFAEALLVYGITMRPPDRSGGLRISVIAPDPEKQHFNLVRAYPHAAALLEHVQFLPADTDIETMADPAVTGVTGQLDAVLRQTAIFVFEETDSRAYLKARQVRQQTQAADTWRVPVFVRMANARRYQSGLRPMQSTIRGDEVIEPFGQANTISESHEFLDWQELLAQKVHSNYRELYGQATQRSRSAFNPDTDWHHVTEQVRESNRRAVNHFVVNLVLSGYAYLGGVPRLPGLPVLSDADRLRIARREHASWSADKMINGWRYNADRDDRRMRHNCLVPFEQLGDEVRKDLNQFDAIARLFDQSSADSSKQLEETGIPKVSLTPTLLPEIVVGIIPGGPEHADSAIEAASADIVPGVLHHVAELLTGASAPPGESFLVRILFVSQSEQPLAPAEELLTDLLTLPAQHQSINAVRVDYFLVCTPPAGKQQALSSIYQRQAEQRVRQLPGLVRWLDLSISPIATMAVNNNQAGLVKQVIHALCDRVIDLTDRQGTAGPITTTSHGASGSHEPGATFIDYRGES